MPGKSIHFHIFTPWDVQRICHSLFDALANGEVLAYYASIWCLGEHQTIRTIWYLVGFLARNAPSHTLDRARFPLLGTSPGIAATYYLVKTKNCHLNVYQVGLLDKPWSQAGVVIFPPGRAFILFTQRVQYHHCSSICIVFVFCNIIIRPHTTYSILVVLLLFTLLHVLIALPSHEQLKSTSMSDLTCSGEHQHHSDLNVLSNSTSHHTPTQPNPTIPSQQNTAQPNPTQLNPTQPHPSLSSGVGVCAYHDGWKPQAFATIFNTIFKRADKWRTGMIYIRVPTQRRKTTDRASPLRGKKQPTALMVSTGLSCLNALRFKTTRHHTQNLAKTAHAL